MENDMTVIVVIVMILYVIGISCCAYYLSERNTTDTQCKDWCCKLIEKYNFFGDRSDDKPILYREV